MRNLALGVFACLLVLGSRPCLAADPWVRYENRHFVAYGLMPPKRLNLSEYDKNALEVFLNTLTDDAFLADEKFSDPFLP